MQRTSRRQAIKLALTGASAVGLARTVGFSTVAVADPSDDVGSAGGPVAIVATVVSASMNSVQLNDDGRAVTARGYAMTRAYAGAAGTVDDLSVFAIGDRVAIEASVLDDGTLALVSIGSVFTPVTVTIGALDVNGTASTDLGRVDLTGRLPDVANAATSAAQETR